MSEKNTTSKLLIQKLSASLTFEQWQPGMEFWGFPGPPLPDKRQDKKAFKRALNFFWLGRKEVEAEGSSFFNKGEVVEYDFCFGVVYEISKMQRCFL